MADKTPNTVQITIKVTPDVYKSLQKLSTKNNQNMAAVVREFINKGLDVQGYKDDVDFIAGLVRQEVKVEIRKQADRLAAMLFKIGTISAGGYFLGVRMLSDMISPSMQEDYKDINANARRLGIDYMKQTVSGVVEFLEDKEATDDAADKIKTDFTVE